MSTEAMKLALAEIKIGNYNSAAERLEAALAQPQQEPVAWMHEWEDGEKIPMLKGRDDRNQDKPKTVRPLVYGDTSPQPAQPQQEPVQRKPDKNYISADNYGLSYEDTGVGFTDGDPNDGY